MTGFDYDRQTPELRVAIDTVAGMGNTEFRAACIRVGIPYWYGGIADYGTPVEAEYWALHDERGELVAEA